MNKYLDQFGNLTSEYYGYVYLTIDQKHNKVYVGRKKGKVERTKKYFGSGKIIFNIRKLRGTYFLKKIILGVCYNSIELEKCEVECKLFFNALNKLYGYNIILEEGGKELPKGKIPWNKGLTKETDERIARGALNNSESQKGKKLSIETCSKMGEAKKGRLPWNTGLTKENNESLKQMSEAKTGKNLTEEHKKKIGESGKGRKHTEETKLKISKKRKGHIGWNKGLTKETDERVKNNYLYAKNPK